MLLTVSKIMEEEIKEKLSVEERLEEEEDFEDLSEDELEDEDVKYDDDVEQRQQQEEEVPEKRKKCQRRRKSKRACTEETEIYEFLEEGEEEDEEEREDDLRSEVSETLSVLSAISFEWENKSYKFEELCDPGVIAGMYRRFYAEPKLYDEIGRERYLHMCRILFINPCLRFLKLLGTTEIDLSYRGIDSKSIQAMCSALETNNVVERFILKFNELKKEDCRYIGLMLRNNKTLATLDFTGCRIGPENIRLLIEYLSYNENVEELNLSKCNIEDEGVYFVSKVLMRNNSIRKLDLSYNHLTEAADALVNPIKVNTCLTELNLRYNNLFNPAVLKGFFRALMFNRTITYLDMAWNGMGGEDNASFIANFMKKNATITFLDLSNNRFQGTAVLQLKNGLSRSRSLETLKLGRNPMLPEDLDNILSGAKGCTSLKVLDLEDLWAKKSFNKILNKIQADRDLKVIIAGVLGDYQVYGPDYAAIILKRANFEAAKPKSKKQRKDFGHFIWSLGEEPIEDIEFMEKVTTFNAKISEELFPELMGQFCNPRTKLIDVVAMRTKYLSIFPDSTPPPPPKVKPGKKDVETEKINEEQDVKIEKSEKEEGKKQMNIKVKAVKTNEHQDGDQQTVGMSEEEEQMLMVDEEYEEYDDEENELAEENHS